MKNLKITDINGLEIEVPNLNEAIEICTQYKELPSGCSHLSIFEQNRKAYWSDIHNKLVTIQNHLSTSKTE